MNESIQETSEELLEKYKTLNEELLDMNRTLRTATISMKYNINEMLVDKIISIVDKGLEYYLPSNPSSDEVIKSMLKINTEQMTIKECGELYETIKEKNSLDYEEANKFIVNLIKKYYSELALIAGYETTTEK